MGAPRRKNLIVNRRKTDEDGEDEGSVALGTEDSLSEASLPSDAEEDADADGEGSDASDIAVPSKNGAKRRNGDKSGSERNGKPIEPVVVPQNTTFNAHDDTKVMKKGMEIPRASEDVEAVHFDEASDISKGQPSNNHVTKASSSLEKVESPVEKRRREHEEYKKKRDEDPAFVPNRGGFFMHDHRTSAPGQNGFRPSGARGKPRAKGVSAGHFPSSNNPQSPSNATDIPWAHDLHETVIDPRPSKPIEPKESQAGQIPHGPPQKAPLPLVQTTPPNRSFSRTVQIANVQLRVFMPGMKEPIVFSGVPLNQHTRLPHHRPPLRRDKAVRVSLPNTQQRYIFPALERSFIFIPRALRPNQQGYGRGRPRGSLSGISSYPNVRSSVYGGSVYSPSVAMSRRSSLAREIGREGVDSPAGSVISRNRSAVLDPSKPVVRLPPAIDVSLAQPITSFAPPPPPPYMSHPASPAPVVNLPQQQPHPLPQKPLSQNWPGSLPMHQPRPQKQVSVADIESPASLGFNPPPEQQQQPFHHQVPLGMNTQPYNSDVHPHSRRPSHPSQRGTPLSQIPERAIHAQPFQPFPYQHPQAFYPQQFTTPVYYYPPAAHPLGPSPVGPTGYVPEQQYPYVLPAPPAGPPEATSQPGTVAHESNGMVYYYDSSQLAATAEEPPAFPHVAFAPPNGYMIPQPTVFYPQQ